jgi:guanine deaminase
MRTSVRSNSELMDNPFMARAIQLSIENVRSGRGGPFGAVVVKSGLTVAEAANKVTLTNDPTAHAEMTAIREACQKLNCFDLQGCEIYTSCEPCPMCLGAIYWARLDRIYFANGNADAATVGFDDSFIYGELLKPLDGRRIPMSQIMREQALEAFREWQEKPDKIEY